MQIGASAFQSDASIVSRVGSASAFMRSDVLLAQLCFTVGRLQHAARCRKNSSSLSGTRISYKIHRRSSMDMLGSTHRRSSICGEGEMSEVKEAVRSRYAGVAK